MKKINNAMNIHENTRWNYTAEVLVIEVYTKWTKHTINV